MRKNLLLSSVAFANKGASAMARYKKSPDPTPLLAAAAVAAEGINAMSEAADLEKRAPDMAAMLPYWDKTDAIVEGYDAIKACGRSYLPQFIDEDNNDYDNRLKLTKYTNVYRDIVEGLASKPFEEEISLEKDTNAEIEVFAEDVDGDGNNLTMFAALTFFNAINSAIDWIFIDYPTVDRSKVRTLADEKAAGVKPFWSHILGRNMLEVQTTKFGGKSEISYARIFEPGCGNPDRVRVFKRDPATSVVTWELWEKQEEVGPDNKRKYKLIDSNVITISVIPLVPFSTGRRDGSTWKFFPAMQDAADLQIQLYQDESALKYIKTLSGYPMLAANGLRPEMMPDGKTPKKVRVGPSRVLWGVPDGNGNHGEWVYVEPTAANMKFLAEDIKETKQDLRELGRQPLTATSGNLTVITTAVAAGKARTAVGAWALGLKDALENALVITCMWMKIEAEPEVNVYNEFDNFAEGNTDVEALNSARERGDISRVTYWKEYKRRKILSPEFDADEETAELLKEVPGDPDLEEDDDKPPTKPEKVK